MYKDYWQLTEMPFEDKPDPRFLFLSRQHEEALSRLVYVVKQEKGAGLLTGIFGCGKTLLCYAVLNELERNIYKVCYIGNPRLNDINFLKSVIYQLRGEEQIVSEKADLLALLEKILVNNKEDGKKTIIIIDEAHSIENADIFEEIRLLLNLRYNFEFLTTLILVGQPDLKQKVEDIKPLNQRIYIRYNIGGLDEQEIDNYILHRLNVAGRKEPIFTQEAIRYIYQNSGGIPRRINQICDMSLLLGSFAQLKKIGQETVREAIKSLDGLE